VPLFKKHSKHEDTAEPQTPEENQAAAQVASAASGSADDYSRDSDQYAHSAIAENQGGKTKGKHKALKRVLIVLVILIVAAGIAAALYINNINNLLKGDTSEEEQAKINSTLTGDADFDKPFYMLLIGSDARVGDSSMGQRSDTNILVRVDAPSGKVTLVSIPRDTAINFGQYGTIKFNAAYAYDGAAGTIKAANQLTGAKISHYATIDFDGLTQLVDAVGGVDVDVKERIDDPDAGDIVIEKGNQHLNGAAALVFARSRAYADGDFSRVSNQRILIEAIADKLKKLDATQLTDTVEAAAKTVTTDMSAQDLVTLALLLHGSPDLTIYSATLPSTTGMVGDASYVFADVPGIQTMMTAVDVGKDPASKAVQNAIKKADDKAANGTGSSSSSNVGSNAVSQEGTSGQSGTSDGTQADGESTSESSGTGYYDPNAASNDGIAANGGNVSGNNYGAVDDN
jgi:LCP family protein required for cell wall assembly